MKVSKYSISAGAFVAVAAFSLLHLVTVSGTAEESSKSCPAACGAACASSECTNAGVGTVVMWWGARDAVPAGWEICNGQKAQTTGAVLAGVKPNLIDRFPKGAQASRKTIGDLCQGVGGNNNMPALQIASIDGLKIAEDGDHSHGSFNLDSSKNETINQAGGSDAVEVTVTRTISSGKGTDEKGNTVNEGRHSHNVEGFIGTEGGVNADGEDRTGANQPAYAELFFIIKVK